jgi:hypothetical protein
MQIELSYDTTFFDPATVAVQPTGITGKMSFLYDASEEGHIQISAMGGAAGLRGQGHLFDIYGKIRANVPSGTCSTIHLDSVAFYNSDVDPLCLDVNADIQVCAGSEDRIGDLNDDGKVDVADAMWALKIAVGEETQQMRHVKTGDLNGDGRINSADAVMLQRLSVNFDQVNPAPYDDKSGADPRLLSEILDPNVPVTVTILTEQVKVGEEIDIPIQVDNATGLAGYDVTITYPDDVLSIVEVREGTVTGPYPQLVRNGDGNVNISMGRKDSIYGEKQAMVSGTLAVVKFLVNAMPEGGIADVKFEGIPALKGQYGDSFNWFTTVNKVNGQIQISSQEGEGEGEGEGQPEQKFLAFLGCNGEDFSTNGILGDVICLILMTVVLTINLQTRHKQRKY